MFGIRVHVDAADVFEKLRLLTDAAGPNRKPMHGFMAQRVEETTRDYVDSEVATDHRTASRLGARPTRFYPRAAGSINAYGLDDGVSLVMQRAGLSRAFYTYVITPKHGPKWLTIPVNKQAYGKRARDFRDLKWRRFTKEDVAAGKSDAAGLVLGKPAAKGSKKRGVQRGMFVALFRAAKKTVVPQDRKILPSDEQWADAAEEGVWSYFQRNGIV